MLYRKFGKLDWEMCALEFGTMLLPVVNKNHRNVDKPEAIRMMRYAFDYGVNYVDSSHGYHQGVVTLMQHDLAEHGVKLVVCRIKRIRKKLGLRCKQKRKFRQLIPNAEYH